MTGLAHLDDIKVMFIGHQKGKNLAERKKCNFGCAHPEGYRKALVKMRLAEKFGLPIISFIDTPGAYPGITAEERGQASVIAENLMAMSQIRTPIVGVVIGEGGSGGALGIGIGDRLAMLEFTYYSVISPEGCATILWKGSEHAPKAAAALKLTSRDLLRFGIIDEIIAEPPAGPIATTARPPRASRPSSSTRSGSSRRFPPTRWSASVTTNTARSASSSKQPPTPSETAWLNSKDRPRKSKDHERELTTANLPAEPGAGIGPEAVGRPRRNSEDVRSLRNRQPREVTELDQLCRCRVGLGKTVHGIVDCQ